MAAYGCALLYSKEDFCVCIWGWGVCCVCVSVCACTCQGISTPVGGCSLQQA